MKTVGIIGGGIVGLATAYKVVQSRPDLRVVLFEKETAPGQHQTTHNSGVLHAGLYYRPGSAKARLAVSGLQQMLRFCRENSVRHDQCGKLVVATDEAERGLLKNLQERGTANGLQGLRWLSPEEAREREPNVGGVAALLVPEEGIVDYAQVVERLAAAIKGHGHSIRVGWPVRRLTRSHGAWIVESDSGTESCDYLVNTAGLHCDRVARLTGESVEVQIVPFRGEYYKIRPERLQLVRHLVYPVANPKFPFLGVHFTRLIGGGLEAGPNAVLAFAREGYAKSDVNLRDLAESLFFPGLWRFGRRHWRLCWEELRVSFSRKVFARALQKLVPDLRESDLVTGPSGVRAQAMRRDGTLVEDFSFLSRPGILHVLNAPSPAATASLAIADEILSQMVV